MEGKVRKKKSPALSLRVTINKKKIQEKNATETFLSTIKALGPEQVANLQDIRIEGFPLVVASMDCRMQMRLLGKGWFVCTHMPTKSKKSLLERIAKQLDVKIKVEMFQNVDIQLKD